jgi:hypothetical protein
MDMPQVGQTVRLGALQNEDVELILSALRQSTAERAEGLAQMIEGAGTVFLPIVDVLTDEELLQYYAIHRRRPPS